MADTTPKLKRRRWPWLVVAMVLAVVLFRPLRPKSDQRFVGRWVTSSGPIEHIYHLNPDGSGTFLRYSDFMGYEPWNRLTWWINDGQLVIRKSSLSVMAPFEDLTIVAYTTLGGTRNRRENSFNIRESGNGLSLLNGTGFEQLIKLETRQQSVRPLVRLPE